MPNVDLLCLITGADIDGSVCASKRRNAALRGGAEKEEGGGRDWFRLLVRKVTPFSVRIRAEEKRRRRSGTVERNGQQYCRRGPGDLRGADRKGLAGAARVTREINYTLLEVLTSDRTPEADCVVRDPPRLFPPRPFSYFPMMRIGFVSFPVSVPTRRWHRYVGDIL